jgi:hypothetical protein
MECWRPNAAHLRSIHGRAARVRASIRSVKPPGIVPVFLKTAQVTEPRLSCPQLTKRHRQLMDELNKPDKHMRGSPRAVVNQLADGCCDERVAVVLEWLFSNQRRQLWKHLCVS